MKPDPTFDDVLMHLFDISAGIALGNAVLLGILLTFLWQNRPRRTPQIPDNDEARFAYDEEPFLYDEAFKPFPKALLELAQTPVYTRNEVFKILNEMMKLSHNFINSGLFMVMNTDENFDIGIALINNIWNEVWEELPEDRRFFSPSAFLRFYAEPATGSIVPENDEEWGVVLKKLRHNRLKEFPTDPAA